MPGDEVSTKSSSARTAEDKDAGLEGARERLAAEDLAMAALLAADDPAADLAARVLAMNNGNMARALVRALRALRDRERSVSRGLLETPDRGVISGRFGGRTKPA